jgi:4-hydroxy-tetrahydrodipicolinate synthase
LIGTDGAKFGRLLTAMVTPFNDAKQIDYQAVDRIVEHLIATGTTAIVVAGTTGESPTLEADEKHKLMQHVIKRAGGKVKIVMGTGSYSTKESIAATRTAEEDGADGVLVVAPYYNKPSQAGLLEHYSQIAAQTKLSIFVYNIPSRTGINVQADTMLKLISEHSNIYALKDSTGGTDQAAEIAGQARANFRIYSGDDYLTLPFLSIGACGIVSVASHIIGKSIDEMMEHFVAGRLDEARKLHYRFLPLFKGLFAAPNPSCVKYALSRLNLCSPILREPLVALNEDQKKVMDALLAQANVTALAKTAR